MASGLRNISNFINVIKSRRSLLTSPIKRRYANATTWPPEKLRKRMELFQKDDGIPVYIKGGFGDKILFSVTCVLTVIGYLDGMYYLLTMAYPKKK